MSAKQLYTENQPTLFSAVDGAANTGRAVPTYHKALGYVGDCPMVYAVGLCHCENKSLDAPCADGDCNAIGQLVKLVGTSYMSQLQLTNLCNCVQHKDWAGCVELVGKYLDTKPLRQPAYIV